MSWSVLKYSLTKAYPDGIEPLSRNGEACGYDIRVTPASPVTLQPNESYVFPTSICLELPRGVGGFIYPRSGLGCKGIILRNTVGVIDPDYRGEIKVCLVNTSSEPFTVQPYDRVAQLVLHSFIALPAVQTENLSETERGAKGFGSSGVK